MNAIKTLIKKKKKERKKRKKSKSPYGHFIVPYPEWLIFILFHYFIIYLWVKNASDGYNILLLNAI